MLGSGAELGSDVNGTCEFWFGLVYHYPFQMCDGGGQWLHIIIVGDLW